MKLRYYLRGLGIGILVTAVIMSFSMRGKRELTDAQIKERAAALGMVEESAVLLPGKTENEPTTAPETETTKAPAAENEPTQTPVTKDEPTQAPSVETTKSPEASEKVEQNSKTEEPETKTQETDHSKADELIRESEDAVGVAGGSNKTNTDNKKTSQSGPVTITVESGNGSDVVSRKLVEAGLVDNAETFDKYLCNHDYDYKITIGKHTIPSGSTYDEIARILISAAE